MDINISALDSRKKELENCDFVKTIMMTIIILYHCFFVCGDSNIVGNAVPIPLWCEYIIDFFSSFQNYTFVFVSGYIYSYIRLEKGGYSNYFSFLKNKALRLLVPYFSVSILWGIPWKSILLGMTFKEVVVQWLLGVNPDQLWFLLMLFEVSCIYRLIERKINQHIYLGTTICLILYFIGIIGILSVPNVYRIFNTLQMLIFFHFGYNYRKSKSAGVNENRIILFSLLSYVILYMFYECLKRREIFFLVVQIIAFFMKLFGTFAAFSILQKVGRNIDWRHNKLFLVISKKTMSMYLLHQQIIYLFVLIFLGKYSFIVLVLITFISSFVISLLISCGVSMNSKLKFMLGEK